MRLIVLASILAAALGLCPCPALARQPAVTAYHLEAAFTVWKGENLILKRVCVAERCAICRDLVTMRACRNLKLQLKYKASDTTLDVVRLRSLTFAKKGYSSEDYFPAHITLRSGKTFQAKVRVRNRLLPVTFCGENDIGTISCLAATEIKSVVFK